MKISWVGFLGKNHSWSHVSHALIREFKKQNHDVHLFSTNGLENFPDDLKADLKGFSKEKSLNEKELLAKINKSLDSNYDMQCSYTAFHNFRNYLLRGESNRFGIWNYETTILPNMYNQHVKFADLVLPSSNFSKEIFAKNGVPSRKQEIIPHGVNLEKFNTKPFQLKTNKKIKILANIAQPHLRKNIPNLLEAFGKAFTKEDDVCLVIKISKKSSTNSSIDVSFNEIYKSFEKKYPNHAEVNIIDYFIENIESLYLAVDVVYSMSRAECWWLPGTEGMAAKKIVIAPNYGGQLDYMNSENSFLINGKVIRADPKLQYWNVNSPHSVVFDPDVDHAATLLKEIYCNYDLHLQEKLPAIIDTANAFTWEKAANKMLGLAK